MPATTTRWRRSWRWAAGLIFLVLLLGILSNPVRKKVFAVLPSINGENVLQFQFETSTPGFLTGAPFAWSPDGRRLLSGMLTRPDAAGRQDVSLWLFDVDDEKAMGHRVLDGRATQDAGIAWSPDGELLAVVKRSGEIRVYSSRDFREVARRDVTDDDAQLDHFGRVQMDTGVAFSKDGSSLWIARLAQNVRAKFAGAVQLDARTLDVIDSYEIDPPIPGNRTVTARTTIEPTPNGPRLVTLISSYTGIKAPNGADTAHRFVYGVDLDEKRELFPHFQLVEDNTLYQYLGAGILLSPDATALIVLLSAITDPRQRGSNYRDVDVYSTQTGQRVALFDTAKAMGEEQPSLKFFGRSGAVLIAESYRVSDKAPGLIVFETNTGAVIERVTGKTLTGGLGFSWDRHRIVASLAPFGNGMQFFAVNR
jgi:dipeptidyl aminopeptidase/acylaminoacyl peptidase